MSKYYPVKFLPQQSKPPRNAAMGLSQNPVVWLIPGQTQKLNEEEYNKISKLSKYKKMVKQGVVQELESVVIADTKPEPELEDEINKENLFDDLSGFSVNESKAIIAAQNDIETLQKWLDIEQKSEDPRVTLTALINSRIKSLQEDEL